MITQVSDSLYTRLAQAFEEEGSGIGHGPLAEVREAAFQRFKSAGFPTVKNEDWKYTNLQPLLKKDYVGIDTYNQGNSLSESTIQGFSIPDLDAYKIVMVNGMFKADLSDTIDIPGLRIIPINNAMEDEVFVKHFAAYADKTDNPFVALNTAMLANGLFIHVAKNVVLEKPIQIVRISTGDDVTFTMTRTLYVLDSNAEVEIVESIVGIDTADHLTNHVTEVALEENARLQHYTIQTSEENCQYINHIEVYQKKHSLYNNYNANFPGSSFVRNDINVRMDDSAVESHLYGIVLIDKNQFVDNHTIVDHLKPHCESYEWYKTITQDESTAVFNGKIFVREDAQKTNAFQQNNNVLIGDRSSVYSKPQLEIFADDVKCSHGCTIGQFDDESLFYLRARGVGEEKAKVILVQAFAFDVTNRFSNDTIRHYVEGLIEKSLG